MSTFAILMASMAACVPTSPVPNMQAGRVWDGRAIEVKSPTSVSSGLYVKSDGTIAGFGSTVVSPGSITPAISAQEWLSNATGADWEVRCTQQSGEALDSGTSLNSWWSLSSDRSWWWDGSFATGAPDLTSECTVEFRLAAVPATVYSFSGITISGGLG